LQEIADAWVSKPVEFDGIKTPKIHAASLEMAQVSADHRVVDEAVGAQLHATDSFEQFSDGHGKFLIADCQLPIAMKLATFPLTLTLSRGAREQPFDISLFSNATEQKTAEDLPSDWKQFPLSPGERAGVRGNETKSMLRPLKWLK
jgi:hypothetical protein